MKEIISKYRTRYGLSIDEVCSLLGVKRSTFYALMRNPERVTVGMIRTLHKALRVPMDELKEII